MRKRIVSLYTAIALLLTMLPYFSMDAYAESSSEHPYKDIILNASSENSLVEFGSDGYGALYDIDGNGIDELIMVYNALVEYEGYTDIEAMVYSVYTISNGNAIPLIEKDILYVLAGGPIGFVGVAEKNNTKYLTVMAQNGEVFNTDGFKYLYSLSDLALEPYTIVEYSINKSLVDNNIVVDVDKSSVKINGQKCAYSDLEEWEEWEKSADYLVYLDPFGESINGMILEELLLALGTVESSPDSSEMSDWSKAYYDYIAQDKNSIADLEDWDNVNYSLLYIDEDSIPELWIDYGYDYAGCKLITYSKNGINEEYLSYGTLTFQEYKNIFHYYESYQVAAGDTIYKLENGQMVEIAYGLREYFSGEFTWDGVSLSEEDYGKKLEEYVDTTNAINTGTVQHKSYSYDEILKYLQSVDTDDDLASSNKESSSETSSHTGSQKKRLVQVNYDSGNSSYLHYNDQTGLLERVTFSSGSTELIYEYDGQNRLVKFECGDHEEDFYDYRYVAFSYDKDGHLATWEFFSPEFDVMEGTAVYDNDGKLIQTIGKARDREETVTYIYDESGILLETRQTTQYTDEDSNWVIVTNYQCDEQGRIVQSTKCDHNSNWNSNYTYHYDDNPFVFIDNGDHISGYYDPGCIDFNVLLLGYDLPEYIYEYIYYPFYFSGDEIINKVTDEDGYISVLEMTDWNGDDIDKYEFIYEEIPINETRIVSDVENQNSSEWINKHIQYANSEQFKKQVTPGFNGALEDALEDIKDNGMITAYNTLDSINTILDFDLDLTDEQEYELLLAQILFSRNGVESIEGIYEEYLSDATVSMCEFLLDLPEFVAEVDKDKLETYKQLLNTLKGLVKGTTEYSEAFDALLSHMDKIQNFDFSKSYNEAYNNASFKFAAAFVGDQFSSTCDTLKELVLYLAAGEAYCNTSDAFGEMLIELRKNIAIPSNDVRFAPDTAAGLGVTDETIWNLLELENANNSIGPDPLNTPVFLSALATAIENYYIALESYEQDGAKAIAFKALANYADATCDNLMDAGVDVALSMFECIPIIKEFDTLKKLFDGTQFVIDTFTKIDSRAYLGTMVMRLYAIAYIHYYTVDGLSNTDTWGMTGLFLGDSEFSKDEQYSDAVLFDESVAVYRAILSVATEYAKEYYTTYYETANSILDQHPGYQPSIPSYVDTNSDTFKSVKQKIIELQMQKNDSAYEWCHSSKVIFNQLHDVNTYDSTEMLIYSFKCPVSVTFKNEAGEVIATLSNGNSTVAAGYEQYFFTSEVISGSGEYVKIAAVPKSYEVVIEGTGSGRMDVSVSEYTDGQLGETKQYFGVPVSENSIGYFSENNSTISLFMDNTTYIEGDYSDVALNNANVIGTYIVSIVIGIACIALLVYFNKWKHSKKVN